MQLIQDFCSKKIDEALRMAHGIWKSLDKSLLTNPIVVGKPVDPEHGKAIEYGTAPDLDEVHRGEVPEDGEVFEVKRMHFDALRTVMFIREYFFEMRAVHYCFLIDPALAKGENLIEIRNFPGKKFSTIHDEFTVQRIKDEASEKSVTYLQEEKLHPKLYCDKPQIGRMHGSKILLYVLSRDWSFILIPRVCQQFLKN